ncbi:hypothetical protein WR05_11660, partial [Escherichia coli]
PHSRGWTGITIDDCWKGWAILPRQKQKKLIMLPSETMIWQPEFTDKTLSRKPGAVHCGLNAWACPERSAVWLSHLPDVMASVSFIWMPAPNVCRIYPLSTGNQKQHEIINHGNSAGYSDCMAAGQYRLRIGNYL